MNEKFYCIGRGNLNINGKFYYGLDYEITDFMRSLEEENKQLKEQLLKEQLQQREDIINKAKEFIEKHNETIGKLYFKCSNMYLLSEIKEDLLKILDNKGDENNGL